LQLPWQGEFAPLSVFHKRLTEAEQQQKAPDGTFVQQGWILNQGNLTESLRPPDHTNQAVQAAFAEWSRQSDLPSLALAFDDQLEVLPLDLVRKGGLERQYSPGPGGVTPNTQKQSNYDAAV
jgi:hypothetical protein